MRTFFRFLRILAKDCGVLILKEGRELSVIDVKSDRFVVQDVYGRSKAISLPRNDPTIGRVELRPEFE